MFFSRHRISHQIERLILRFLVENNPNALTILSTIRNVNKGAKQTTQIWEEMFLDLRKYLDANPTIQRMVFRHSEFNERQLIHNQFNTILTGLSTTNSDSLIKMLQGVLTECDQWQKNTSFLESKDLLECGKNDLRKLYLSLEDLLGPLLASSLTLREWYLLLIPIQ